MLKNIILFSCLLFLITCAYNGIDVSYWQGNNVNFNKVKAAGRTFVIMRAGIGLSEDVYFQLNYEKAKEAGLDVGVYWYCQALSVEESTAEANKILSILKGKQFEYPIYYDIENQSLFNKGKELTSAIAKNFCNILEQNNYFCGIYASKYYLETYFDDVVKTRYTIWVAQYYDQCTYQGPYKVWQRSSEGHVDGIDGNVDLDESYADFASIMKAAHLNGF
jgi:GH25 family lysozyme M1 (1,4-beta-N-acetylmuramidase)